MISSAILDWYFSRGLELVPGRADDPKKPPEGWRETTYTRTQIEVAAQMGRSVLWKIGNLDLVIDVDLYRGPEVKTHYEKLCREFGGSVSSVAPTIQTPRGGRHHYFRVPTGYDLRKHLDAEYGHHIEFLGRGHYVLIPGSPHPEVPGSYYQFDYVSPLNDYAPVLPAWLAQKLEIRRPVAFDQKCPYWSEKTLRAVLSYLPVQGYSTHDVWAPIFFAAHYATGGSIEGMHTFVDWCVSDPNFRNDGPIIENRWHSLTVSDKPLYVTHATLKAEIIARHGYIPADLQGVIDWGNDDFGGNDEAQAPFTPTLTVPPSVSPIAAPPMVQIPAINAPPQAPRETTADKIKRLRDHCDRLTEFSDSGEIEHAIELLGYLDSLQMAKFVKLISMRTGVPTSDIKKRAIAKSQQIYAAECDLGRRARRENAQVLADGGDDDQDPVPTDLGQYLAELVLQKYYADGEHLIYTPEGQYWHYCGTHWKPRSVKGVEADIHSTTLRLRAELSAAAAFSVSNLMHQASHILGAMCAKKGETFFNDFDPTPVINCKNGELWIDGHSGRPDFRSHSPASALRSCLSIDYDPSATCPQWTNGILGMFAPLKEPLNVAAHLMELIGYTIQPKKNFAAWVLLYGTGDNGKSLVIDVLTTLLGDGVISIALNDFARDNHALAGVIGKLAVIEDDLKKGVNLPDDILKKLSENKILTGNPKHRDGVQFRNIATAWISSNHWPKTSDLSEGMRRRPYIFEFRRNFKLDGTVDYDLKEKIICNELSGVLNLAIAGLIKIRRRGKLHRPEDCEESRRNWIDGTNQMRRFFSERLQAEHGASVSLRNVFEVYKLWCESEGIKRTYSRSGIAAELKTTGYRIEKVDSVYQVFGLKLVSEDW